MCTNQELNHFIYSSKIKYLEINILKMAENVKKDDTRYYDEVFEKLRSYEDGNSNSEEIENEIGNFFY